MRNRLLVVFSLALFMIPLSLLQSQRMPKNIRMVIGSSSTGGDTYQAAAILADFLSNELNIHIKADAVGVSEAYKATKRDKNGTTLMLFHDQAYLGYFFGNSLYDDIFTTYTIGPTVAINPSNAYLVPANSPFQNMEDIFRAVSSGQKVRVAIQPGGASEIGLTAMKNAARIRFPGSESSFITVNTGSQSDKNQAMWDGLADVINGSLQANEQFTELPAGDKKAMRFVWLTSSQEILQQAPEQGIGKLTREKMMQYATPATSVTFDGHKDFTYDKEFFLLYNKKMPQKLVDAIDSALTNVFAKGEIQKRQESLFLIPSFRPSKEALIHLKEKSEVYRKIIDAIS